MALPFINLRISLILKLIFRQQLMVMLLKNMLLHLGSVNFQMLDGERLRLFDPCSLADYLGVCVGADGAYDEKIKSFAFSRLSAYL